MGRSMVDDQIEGPVRESVIIEVGLQVGKRPIARS